MLSRPAAWHSRVAVAQAGLNATWGLSPACPLHPPHPTPDGGQAVPGSHVHGPETPWRTRGTPEGWASYSFASSVSLQGT